MFWCNELLESKLNKILADTLLTTWLWYFGPMCSKWINAFANVQTANTTDMQLLCYKLASLPKETRDASLYAILLSESTVRDLPPDRVTRKTPLNMDMNELTAIERYFVHAIHQGKARVAWWAVQHIDTRRSLELLKMVRPTKIGVIDAISKYATSANTNQNIVIQCMLIITCASSFKEVSLLSDIDAFTVKKLSEWSTLTTNRQKRVYEIPVLCLYAVTKRGKMHYTENNKRSLSYCEPFLKGGIWDEELSSRNGKCVGERLVFDNDDIYDEFYNTIFVDDIPDEWTAAEKRKSHGDGVLGPNESIGLLKLTRIWFGPMIARFAYDFHKSRQAHIANITFTGAGGFAEVCGCYTTKRVLKETAIPLLGPVKKVLFIDTLGGHT